MSVSAPRQFIVFGATGRTGRSVVKYLLDEGHLVTGFARSLVDNFGMAHPRLNRIAGDVKDPDSVAQAIQGHEAVLSTLGAKGQFETLYLGIEAIVAGMQKHGVRRIVAVGGAGILDDEATGEPRYRLPDFPPMLAAISDAHYRAYQTLANSNLDWTMVAPPFTPEGKRTGQYLTRADYFPANAQNTVSVEDVADLMVRELFHPQFVGHRVGIAYPETSA